ncbi:MAG: HAMP domain-containing histidine kinase [Lachnospiraceae bacterium]|nr:HAMP domain-containing histidine kinase [Lachnospiraceae bacterium]
MAFFQNFAVFFEKRFTNLKYAKTFFSFLWHLFTSLKFRIFLVTSLAGVIPCFLMSTAIVKTYEDRAVQVRESDVQAQLRVIASHLLAYDYFADPSSEVIGAELEQLSNLYDGRVIIVSGNFQITKDTYGISDGKYMISEEIVKCFKNGESASNYDKEDGYIELVTPVGGRSENAPGQAGEQVVGVLLTSVSTDYVETTMGMLRRTAMIMTIITALVVLGAAAFFAASITRPLRGILDAIGQVKDGHSDSPLKARGWYEMQEIATAFNEMLLRQNALNDSRKDFVANVSHELKTPLTSMKVLADSLLVDGNASAEMYREFLTDITNEIDRENSIINDLLSLVKLDRTASVLNIQNVDINAMVEAILRRLKPLANRQNVELTFESVRPVNAEVDEVKLSLAISNLVDNAIKYNKPQGFVRAQVDADHQCFHIKVSDSGIGIPDEAKAHIYERFYRVDKSHSKEIGGTGLGLAITYDAILMHHGTIELESKEGQGSEFRIKIPLNYVA